MAGKEAPSSSNKCLYLKKTNPNKLAKIIIKKNKNKWQLHTEISRKDGAQPPQGSAPTGHQPERHVGQRASWKGKSASEPSTHIGPQKPTAPTQGVQSPTPRSHPRGNRGRGTPRSHLSPSAFPSWASGSVLRGVGMEVSGSSGVVHEARGVNTISSGWTLPASYSHPVTSSKSRRVLCRLSFEPAPPGTSRPRPPRRCSPRWRRASGGCGPLRRHRPGGDLQRARA